MQGNSKPTHVPPIKCQGIKTKLVPFILNNIDWDGVGTYIEPCMGSGVVAFNLCPRKALLCDTNPHIINFYQSIKNKSITETSVKEYLQVQNNLLLKDGNHYYEVRSRFNEYHSSFDFLFLNRACFNGLMRFNSRGEFNVPFCKKPNRFSKSYITKIVNQVKYVSDLICKNDYTFEVQDLAMTLSKASVGDFVYIDPPYETRFSGYYDKWPDGGTKSLINSCIDLPCDFAISTWVKNKYRENDILRELPAELNLLTTEHFYHLGSTENLRNSVTEGLIVRNKKMSEIILTTEG